MSEIDLYDSQVKQELQNWKPRQRHIPIVEFNHQPLFRKPEEDENSYLSDKTLTPDELDVDEEDKFGAVFDQINQGIKDLRDSLMNNSTTGPNLQVDSDTTSSTLRSARILKPSAKNQAYSINTELHATFDVPASRFKGNTTDFKLLARNFIEKTKQVYKLKIAIRNRELETANRAGDVNIVKRLRSEESELANEFIQWKQATKRHYKLMLASLVCHFNRIFPYYLFRKTFKSYKRQLRTFDEKFNTSNERQNDCVVFLKWRIGKINTLRGDL
jgi:hypothetical protein